VSPLRRTWGQRAVLGLNLVLIVACLALAVVFLGSYTRVEAINRYELSGSLTPVVDTGGGRVINVLLVGYDSADGLDPDDPVNIGRRGERNGDVIIVAHLDERHDFAALLSFPRDLWVPIAGTGAEQKINAAYAVGGAKGLIDTIEDHFDIPINHYVEVDFAGFQGLVEAVGSVPVWFDAPARDWNAAAGITQTGFLMEDVGCQELGPEEALAYVRSRFYQTLGLDWEWHTDPRGDLGRIERQQDFLRRLLTRAVDRGARNPFTLRQLVDVALRRVTIDQDLTPSDLLELGERFSGFDPAQLSAYTVPVESGTVGTASVLFARHDRLEPILALFRGAGPYDPATVRVELVHDGVSATQVGAVRSRLAQAGYELAGVTAGEAGPGLAVRHAPGAVHAARALAEALGEAAVVADESLDGRDVVVALGRRGEAPDREADPDPGAPETPEPDPAAPDPPDPAPADPAAACR
jgi:LCP family protein required for cell wall assembly